MILPHNQILPLHRDIGSIYLDLGLPGSVCTFYNATHVVSTHYFNGTQESHVSVVDFHDPLNTTYRLSGFTPNLFTDSKQPDLFFSPGVGSHVHLLAMADSLSAHLKGSLIIDGHFGTLTTTTLITETNIFQPYNTESLAQVHSQILGMNTTAHVTNVSQALQEMVANATLGFVNLNTGFTTTEATVGSTNIVYTYERTSLIVTYSIAFLLLLLMSGAGMFCMMKNGEPSSNKFSRLLVALRNPELDVVVEAVEGRLLRGVPATRIRLRFLDLPHPGRQSSGVFALVPHHRRGDTAENKLEI
ncbi:hypothetical protein C8R44DRAFT_888488 [Mycena epipterygia]|nr:hypothetical protein C8R44DRAFT_888488 [Mycena epipterygia]